MPVSHSPERSAAQTLRLSSVTLDHRGGDGRPFRVLDIPELTVPSGVHIGLRGPSGSGKTSLLHLIGGLTVPSTGKVSWGETEISSLSAGGRDRWRLSTLGFVFQDFHLIPELDILANITLPTTFSSWRIGRAGQQRAEAVAARMGLTDLRRRTGALSRGEQQRVAIARAVFRRPAMILADEPTASLDAAHADEVGALLVDAANEVGATLICATHDAALLARLKRRLDIKAATPILEQAA